MQLIQIFKSFKQFQKTLTTQSHKQKCETLSTQQYREQCKNLSSQATTEVSNVCLCLLRYTGSN